MRKVYRIPKSYAKFMLLAKRVMLYIVAFHEVDAGGVPVVDAKAGGGRNEEEGTDDTVRANEIIRYSRAAFHSREFRGSFEA